MTPIERSLDSVNAESAPLYVVEEDSLETESISPEVADTTTRLEKAYKLLSEDLKGAIQRLITEGTILIDEDESDGELVDELSENGQSPEDKTGEEPNAELEAIESISPKDEETLIKLRRALQKIGVKQLEKAMEYLTDDAKNALKALELLTKHSSKKHNSADETSVASDPVTALMREARKYPLLSSSEEIELAKRIEGGDLVAKEQMINSNLRLVVSNARRYRGQGLSMEDMVQEGMLGLIRSAEKFDWRKGYRFSTYSTLWIRQAIQRGLENTSRTIRLPVHVSQRVRKLGRIERELTVKLGHDPTAEEIAQAADLTLEQVIEAQEAEKAVTSLDKPVSEDGETELGDLLPDKQPGTEAKTLESIDKKELYNAVTNLPERHRDVIEMRFGLDGNPPATLDQIGKWMILTPERVRQIEEEALKMLSRTKEIQYLADD
jgi:RNA polymerase primary sigma factor